MKAYILLGFVVEILACKNVASSKTPMFVQWSCSVMLEMLDRPSSSGESETVDNMTSVTTFSPPIETLQWHFNAVWNVSVNSSAIQQADKLCQSLFNLMDAGNVSLNTQNVVALQIAFSSKGASTLLTCKTGAGKPSYECLGLHPSLREDLALLFNTKRAGTNEVASILSTIACSVSIFFFALTIIIHLVIRETRKRRPVKILLNICVTLMTAMLIFMIGVKRTETDAGCLIVTFLLHYCYLAAWCWMAAYSYDIYLSLVKVFTEYRWYMQKLCLMAYGLPLVIVVVTIAATAPQGVDSPNYYRAPNVCWLNNDALRYGFTLPIGLMLLVNLSMFVLVIREVHKMNDKVETPQLKHSAKQCVLVAVTMTTMNGALWVSGIVITFSSDQVFRDVLSWTFMISNSLQGLFVFLLTCVRPQTIRQAWTQEICRICCRRSIGGAIGSPTGNATTTTTFRTDSVRRS